MKSGHSQTIDCLRQTIKAKNDQIGVLTKQVDSLSKGLFDKDKQTNIFEQIACQLKDSCEKSSSIVNKLNQFNMYFLSFYKDFVGMVEEETKRSMSHSDHKYRKMQEQLEICMDLFNIEHSQQCHEANQSVLNELEELINQHSEQETDHPARSKSRMSALGYSKLGSDDTEHGGSYILGIDKALDNTSAISVDNHSYKLTSPSNSFNFGCGREISNEKMRKDIIKLTEENKYLKKRIRSKNTNISDLKWQICPGYVAQISDLQQEKDESEKDLLLKLDMEQQQHESSLEELQVLNNKLEAHKKELHQKMASEGELIHRVTSLENKNEELMAHIHNTINSKEGMEFLHNTVSDLSLSLINKNEKDLSYKQIQLIKVLFEESQIEAVNNFKTQITELEAERAHSCAITKKWVNFSKEVFQPLSRYANGVKECVDLYNFLDLSNTELITQKSRDYFKKHVVGFLAQYNSISQFAPKLGEMAKALTNMIQEAVSSISETEINNFEIFCDMSFKSPEINYESGRKESVDTESTEKRDNISPIGRFNGQNFTPIVKEPFDYSSKDQDHSHDLMEVLRVKEKEIFELKEKLKEQSKSSRKSKKKIPKTVKSKDKAKEKQEKMIQESLDELKLLIDEEQEQFDDPIPRKLDACENNTIREVDEKDEEETVYDKEGNKIMFRSLKSGSNRPSINDQNKLPFDMTPYEVERPWDPIDLSRASESVKFDGDLLNDSLKFEDNYE